MDLKHFTRVLLPPQITSTFSVFLSSYRNTSGGLGEREMMWEHECFHSFFEFSQTFMRFEP